MSDIERACAAFKVALSNPYAVLRREQTRKDIADAWRAMSLVSSQKRALKQKQDSLRRF